jgi:hypothetical protein
MKRFFVVAGILLTLALMAGAAGADVIQTRTRTGAIIIPVGACPGVGCPFLPLNNIATSTVAPIVTTVDNQRIVIMYNAECTVTAAGTATWVALSIFVDGVLAAPSSTDKAHCTSNNNGSNWVSAVATAVVVIPDPGFHRIQVQGQILNGAAGNTARIDDTTLVVMK